MVNHRAALPPTLTLLAALVLVVAAAPPQAAASAVLNVSADGRDIAYEPAGEPRPGRLLFTDDVVPLPDTPDWSADLERQVGGLAFGDVDGDGDLDLACGCYHANSYPPIDEWETLIYLNQGGTLETTPSWVSVDSRHTADVRFGDVDGDGRPDLFCANGGEGLDASVIYLNGPGGIDPVPDWLAADNTWSLGGAFGDLDGDGDLDLATANQGNTQVPYRPVEVFFNNGSGLSAAPGYASADPAISNSVGLADVDGSSLVQVVGHLLVGDGATTLFQLPHQPLHSIDRVALVGPGSLPRYTVDRRAARIHFAAPIPAGQTVEVDYTHATRPDIAVSRWVNFATCFYGNTASGITALPAWTTGDASRSDKGLGWADVDGDGDLDLAFGGTDPTVLYDNAAGVLTGPVWSSVNSYHGCQDLAWGDVDGDGDEDLATIHFGNGHVRVYLNEGGVLPATPSWMYDLSSSGTAIAWGDVNGDGWLDLAAGTARQPLVLFLNRGATTALPELAAPGAAGGGAIRAFPNPFNPSTWIRVPVTASAAAADRPDAAPARLAIIDAAGRQVRTLALVRRGDALVARWDGRDAGGRAAASGVYFAHTVAVDGSRRDGRLVLAR